MPTAIIRTVTLAMLEGFEAPPCKCRCVDRLNCGQTTFPPPAEKKAALGEEAAQQQQQQAPAPAASGNPFIMQCNGSGADENTNPNLQSNGESRGSASVSGSRTAHHLMRSWYSPRVAHGRP